MSLASTPHTLVCRAGRSSSAMNTGCFRYNFFGENESRQCYEKELLQVFANSTQIQTASSANQGKDVLGWYGNKAGLL